MLAAIDILITLIAWYVHHRTQPYVYRFQNSVESWLYGATVAFLVLMCIYSALPDEHVMTGAALQGLSIAVLIGSLVGGAAYQAYSLRWLCPRARPRRSRKAKAANSHSSSASARATAACNTIDRTTKPRGNQATRFAI